MENDNIVSEVRSLLNDDEVLESPRLPQVPLQNVSCQSTEMKDLIQKEKNELTRKRDTLATVAQIEGLKSYLGENFSAIQIRKMKKERVETFFQIYQEKNAQKQIEDAVPFIANLYVNGISYFSHLDDKEQFKNDMIDNKQFKKIVGNMVVKITERYGDVLSYFSIACTTGSHLSFSSPKIEDLLAPASTNSAPANTLLTE